MNNFYFNNCLPDIQNNISVVAAFSATYVEYNRLKKSYPDDVDGIVTIKDSNEIILNGLGFSVADCINVLEKSLKVGAYSTFRKYPFYNHFTETDEDLMLENEFSISVAGEANDAYYLKVVADNNGIGFTLSLHSDLTAHPLVINCSDGTQTLLDNLYGEKTNTAVIESIIVESKLAKLGNFEKLVDILGQPDYSSKFKNTFDKYGADIQNSILEHVEKAIKRNGPTKLFNDDNLIKDVTPDKEKDITVSELRIFNPIALRIYFYETDGGLYLSSIEKKPTKEGRTNEQDNQINSAKSTIKQMLLIKKKK